MENQRGSAVAIVMLVLAVVSLIGVALLTQSRLDMQLTTSVRVYDDMTSRADARATEALVRLRGNYRYDVSAYSDAAGTTPTVEPITGFNQVNEAAASPEAPPSTTAIGSTTTGTSSLVGYSINPPAGWQKGAAPDGYVEVFYVVKGRAWNPAAYKTVKSDSTYDVPETTVAVAASVVRKKIP